jgi:hypothetical protein
MTQTYLLLILYLKRYQTWEDSMQMLCIQCRASGNLQKPMNNSYLDQVSNKKISYTCPNLKLSLVNQIITCIKIKIFAIPSFYFNFLLYSTRISRLTNQKTCMGFQCSNQRYLKTKINHTSIEYG